MIGATGSIPCVKAASAPGRGGPRGEAAAAVTGLRATIAFTLDDLPHAQVAFTPMNTCTPKLK
jgi:hypothetical protein